jgi:branched-chain amino acid transport system permease protein
VERFVSLLANGIANGSIYALVALGIVLLQKATGIINFAQGDLLTLGAFVGFWLLVEEGLPQPVVFGLVIVLLFAAGVALERVGYAPLRGRSPLVIVISTFALGLGIRALLVLWQGTTPRDLPAPFGGTFSLFGAKIPQQSLLIVGVLALVGVAVYLLFQKTAVGRQVRALAVDRETALLMGIKVRRLSPLTFGVSAALAGLAGVLVAPILSVSPGLGFGLLLNAFAAVVLGGSERLAGVAFAAMFVAVVQALAAGYVSPNLVDAYPFLILILVLAVRPQGLVRSVTGVRY